MHEDFKIGDVVIIVDTLSRKDWIGKIGIIYEQNDIEHIAIPWSVKFNNGKDYSTFWSCEIRKATQDEEDRYYLYKFKDA